MLNNMFVIVDIEWAVYKDRQSLTQIAATKVDDNWQPIASFSSLIRPQNISFENWKQVCYNGANQRDFICAPSAYTVLRDFENWLNDDDILLFWYKPSCELYSKMLNILFKIKSKRKCIPLSAYLTAVIGKRQSNKVNPYRVAEHEGIQVPKIEHISVNDVNVVLLLLQKAKIEQSQLLLPPPVCEYPEDNNINSDQPFQYDTVACLLHKKGSPCIPNDHLLQGYATIATCIKKDFEPCPVCMADEMKQARILKNKNMLERSQYNFAYIRGGQIFHKCSCHLLFTAKKPILGVGTYEKAIRKNKIPCKKCNPSPFDEPKLLNMELLRADAQKNRSKGRMYSADEARAIKRHKQASQEREEALSVGRLTEQEKQDIYTLTQPEFSFWAAPGYSTFHLRHCSKLNAMSNYQGFKHYSQAVRAGFKPCKECKPTAKHDVNLSIPLGNKVRENDTVDNLIQQCNEYGYDYQEKGVFFIITTPVGEWEINTCTQPIKIRHKNLVFGGDFHNQPRAFLSFFDVLFYLDRHDKTLMRKLEKHFDVDDEEDIITDTEDEN